MVVLALMHSPHLSALVSLVYMAHSAVVAGRGISDDNFKLSNSKNMKRGGVCV